MRDPILLAKAQDAVWESGLYMPHESDAGETTYCNIASQAVARRVGCDMFNYQTDITADQMYDLMKTSKGFLVKPMADCQALVNAGTLIFAILPASKLGQSHGHVCTLTPGPEAFSGHWNAKAPSAMNLGRKGTCFRTHGVNFAFVPVPEFYAWTESL